MKNNVSKTFLSLLLILVASFSFAQNSEDIKFEKTTQKFKRVDEGNLIILNYSFTYNGSVPLHILEPKIDCSCTEITYPQEIIKPNTNHVITVRFNTSDKIGWQERSVIIQFTSNQKDSNKLNKKLIFKGSVKASKATKKAYKKNHKK